LQIVKPVDVTSPAFTAAAMSSIVHPNVVLVGRRDTAPAPLVLLRLTLTNSVFTAVKSGGTSNATVVPVEQISAKPASVKTEIWGQNEKGERILITTGTVNCPQG
jgi:type VI protein secretion system component Hcp